jgi:two-component system, cell cycle response regulator
MTVGATVLIVDDSATIRAVVRMRLEERGYQVREADNGTAAIEQCLAAPPDVVLLDIEMPGLNGHEVLARLKAEESVKDIPVVFLTDHADMAEVLRGLEGGANDYLRKSAVEELVARVGAAARVKKLQDELRLLNLQLDKTSRTDVLTGLFNRRHLEEQLRKSISTGRRREEPVGLLLFDLDHFKSVNDTYGHPAGDAVLAEFASRLEAELRAGDIAGRWGGEEFLVILPHTGLVGTVEAGERIRSAVAEEPFFAADQPIGVTVSGGGAAGVGMSDEDLVHRADNGLYEAKDRGRNCVVVTAETGPPIVTGNWVE